MDKEILRRLQLTQLDIAKEIKRVCEKNDIKYWLESGTLLGAVRHKGFIPWDDDLDIAMRRDDYERFKKIAPRDLSSEYFFQSWETDENFGLPFAKVRKRKTIYKEIKAKNSKANNGIFVDIFPYDNYGDDYLHQGLPIKLLKVLIQDKSKLQVWNEVDGINYIKLLQHIPFVIISKLIDRNKMILEHDLLATKYNEKQCEYCFGQGLSRYGEWTIPTSYLDEMIDMDFEDTTFKVPKEYDAYLTIAYGDYMKLPPEDKRENRHQVIELKF